MVASAMAISRSVAAVVVVCLVSLPAVWAEDTPQKSSESLGSRYGSFNAQQQQHQEENAPMMNGDDFLMMPQMMMTMGRITKGLPLEYRPMPLIVGTKKEIEQLRDELQLPLDLPQDLDPKMTDDQVVSLPLTMNRIIHKPGSASTASENARPAAAAEASPEVNAGSSTSSSDRNSSGRVTVTDLLPLLRTHPITTLIHDEPALVLNILRTLTGPKPSSNSSDDSASQLPDNMQNLISLATRNPVLVRTLARFDPHFIPNLISAILGVDSDDKDD